MQRNVGIGVVPGLNVFVMLSWPGFFSRPPQVLRPHWVPNTNPLGEIAQYLYAWCESPEVSLHTSLGGTVIENSECKIILPWELQRTIGTSSTFADAPSLRGQCPWRSPGGIEKIVHGRFTCRRQGGAVTNGDGTLLLRTNAIHDAALTRGDVPAT